MPQRDLPLAAAQRRLGKPGRPRKALAPAPGAEGARPSAGSGPAADSAAPLPARSPGVTLRTGLGTGSSATPPPRLLDVAGAAAYLGVSPWTVRDLEGAGLLPRVRVPLPSGGALRRVLFDRAALDALIDGWARP